MRKTKEEKKAYNHAWYMAHRENALAEAKLRHAAHKEERREYKKNWRHSHLEYEKGNKLKRYWPGSDWKRALACYDALYQEQQGKCPICQRAPSGARPLVVDHCHKTNVVRGLLCNQCNVAIGMFHEDDTRFSRAAVYLRERKS